MRGYLTCERCDWSRIYTRLSVARLPHFCLACGHRVTRHRNPTEQSRGIAHWRAVADQLDPEQHPAADERQP